MDFCRRQDWLVYAPAASQAPAPSQVTEAAPSQAPAPSQATDATLLPPRGPEADLTPTPAMQTSVRPPPARQITSTSPDANQVDLTAATPPAAGANDTSRKPRRVAKATPEDNAAVPQATQHCTPADGKRKATALSAKSKRRRSDRVVPDTTQRLPDTTNEAVPDAVEASTATSNPLVPDTAAQTFLGTTAEREDNPDQSITETPDADVAVKRHGVSLDDFDFLDALRRDRLFDDIGADDFNAGSGDWLLALDSDAEGDEDSILHDENDDVPSDDDAMADNSDDESTVEHDEVTWIDCKLRSGTCTWSKMLGGFFTMRRRCRMDRSAQRALLLLMLKTH
ncbi:unnamed protein product [Phytophthora fragariaefolia]|uniref:Unnamed protein product n=1 Tax=Phytophthora fragariaefolia TaxID=1490495 RepID=A0A9W7D2P9_9STRA|nr:unnamed protein product [Phytophthora fragariaefolia]